MTFTEMDDRDVTSLLCLALPWLLALLVHIPRPWNTMLPTGYAVLNLLLVLVPIAWHGIPGVLSLSPLKVHDFSNQRAEAASYEQLGIPEWLLVQPRARTHSWLRMNSLEHHHPHVVDFLQGFRAEVGVVSNMRGTIFYTDITEPPPALYPGTNPPQHWLEHSTCMPQDNMAIILFDWDYLRRWPEQFIPDIEAKCPGLPRATFEHSVVYRLDSTIPTYAQGTAFAQQGDWEQAIAIYNEALAANPESVRAYADRGRAYAALDAYEQALADFDAALARMPQWQALQEEREQVRAQAQTH
jgi:tetratricopeptide (TPR) repeat protein